MYDLCIVGGGAAGLSCAISAGRRGKKVLLIEKNNKLGKKLYATGNGKCNLTNNFFDIKNHFNSNSKSYIEFVESVFLNAYDQSKPNQQIINFADSIGICTFNDDNYIYPSSAQASSVVWAMIDEIKNYNIEILSDTLVSSITGKYPQFIIKCQNEAFKAAQIVLANGGMAYKSLGGTDWGYKLAKSMGHTINSPRPSLCGFNVIEDISLLAGVRALCKVKLLDSHNQIISSSQGEVQFTKQGISGICIFELSSKAGRLLNHNQNIKISVSFINDNAYEKLINAIKSNILYERTVIGLLNGFINDKLAQYVCSLHNINGKIQAKNLSTDSLNIIANTLTNTEFNITGLYDMEQAQVTAGGVCIDEINPITMESKLVKGLYIVGELLDIDGICGGYNLTFAMLSGYKAGKECI